MNYLKFNNPKTKITSLISLFLSLSINTAQASIMDKRIDISQFNDIRLEKGLDATIICDDTSPYIIASGSQKTLNKLQVHINQKKLFITGATKDYDAWNFEDNKITLKIYTNTPIETIKTMFGVKITANACAISKKELNVNGSMGVNFSISGQTKKLNAELSMGAKFNSDIDSLIVDSANVNMAMGTEANLCNAKEINGNMAMGGVIYASSHAIDNTNSAIGAMVKTLNCQL
ncbi:GIN domain-containing protein [Xenorhabdus cabanillasii]|uniref:Putative auto-transporter adhesin head GIN domain-containing protein n=1 Tax=Xenorhabdus cabanillasii JM26 TaxID=1427517 RepID=W1J6X8_9GAMM|nr:DUF2807 domain-containing protein [Xenorhabdus cabanillasii]PHM77174.1 hypothetical protein Xcab_02350 [Xenorhabdus cabanillasii JM26]CDL86497.1 exported hypothetical protein [Xenorhabdus cabanillasii JM26]